MRFLISTKNTENEILLFLVFGSFGKIFLLKIKTEIQPNTFLSLFSIFSENETENNQIKHPLSIYLKLIKKFLSNLMLKLFPLIA